MDDEFNDGEPMLPTHYRNNSKYTKFHDLQKDLDAFQNNFQYYFCDLDGPSTAVFVQNTL